MQGRNNRRIITIVACISVLAVVAVMAIAIGLDIRDARMTEKYNREKSALEFEKSQLLIERERLRDDIYSQLGPHAFLTLLINSLDADFVERIYEELSDYSVEGKENSTFTATILLSPEELPDMEGNMTLDKFNWYLDRGYKYAIAYDGETELEVYLENIASLLFDRGIAFPTVICYYGSKKDVLFKDTDKPVLEGYGIKVAASMRSNGVMVEQDMYDGIFSPGILGWNTINVSSNTFNYAINKGGNFGFVFDNENSNTSIYKKSSYINFGNSEHYGAFLRMLDRFLINVKNEKLVVTDYESGLEERRVYLEDYEVIRPTLVSTLEAIDAQIKDIEKELSKISDKYKR